MVPNHQPAEHIWTLRWAVTGMIGTWIMENSGQGYQTMTWMDEVDRSGRRKTAWQWYRTTANIDQQLDIHGSTNQKSHADGVNSSQKHDNHDSDHMYPINITTFRVFTTTSRTLFRWCLTPASGRASSGRFWVSLEMDKTTCFVIETNFKDELWGCEEINHLFYSFKCFCEITFVNQLL